MSFLLTLRNYQLRLGQNIAKQRGSKRLQLTTAGWQLAPRFPQKWENEGPRLRTADLDLDTWISNIQIESVNGAPCSNNRNKTWKIKQKASEGCISKKGNVFSYLCNRYGYQKHAACWNNIKINDPKITRQKHKRPTWSNIIVHVPIPRCLLTCHIWIRHLELLSMTVLAAIASKHVAKHTRRWVKTPV